MRRAIMEGKVLAGRVPSLRQYEGTLSCVRGEEGVGREFMRYESHYLLLLETCK